MRRRLPAATCVVCVAALSLVTLVFMDDALRAVYLSEVLARWLATALAITIVGAGAGIAILVWRVLGPLELTEVSETSDATVRAMIEIGDPDSLARRALHLLWDRSSWVIRRVEQVRFTDRAMVRRRVSVDFRMPEPVEIDITSGGELSDEALELLAAPIPVAREASARAAFVPISLLRGWPPVLNLDLRSASGGPLPLLSKSATNALDNRVLFALTTQAFGEYAEDVREPLETLVHEDGLSAVAAYYVFSRGVARILELKPDVDKQMASRVDELARALVRSTLLWAPATADPGTRTIVKLAYDEPLLRHLGSLSRSLLATLGLRSIVVGFEVGQVGDAGSYHLEIEVPPPLTLISADLAIAEGKGALSGPNRLQRQLARAARCWQVLIEGLAVRIAPAFDRPWAPLVNRANNSQVFTRRAHLYATGQPSRTALATLRMVPERRGAPLVAAITAMAVAALLQALTDFGADIFRQRDASGVVGGTVALLLLAPPMLAYLLSRGTEQAFAGRALAGVRALSIVSITLCVGAAGALIGAVARADRDIFIQSLPILRTTGAVIAAVLSAGLLLPLGRHWRLRD